MLQLQKNKGNAIIIGIIITVVVMIITVLAIYFTLKNMQEQENEIDTNQVNENSYQEAKEKILPGTLYTDMYKHNGTSLIQDDLENYVITGLKNKTVENAINQKILDAMKEMEQELQVGREQLAVRLMGNYADIISIAISGFSESTSTIIKTINCSLITGDDIEFTDLFTSKAAAGEVYKDKLYSRLMWGTYGTIDGPGPNMEEKDYGKIEDIAQEMASDYDNGKEVQFYFTENTIYICEKNQLKAESASGWEYVVLEIPMAEYPEKISIYTRFLSEDNLYENKIEREEPVFCVLQEHDVFERISDHVYLAVYGPEVSGSENEEIADKILENEKKIIREEANQFARLIGSSEYAIYAVNLDMLGNGSQVIVYRSATYIDSSYFKSKELSIGVTKMWDENINYRGFEIPDEKIMKRDLNVKDKRYDENGIQISQQDYEIETENEDYVYIKKNEDGTEAGRYKMVRNGFDEIEFEQI